MDVTEDASSGFQNVLRMSGSWFAAYTMEWADLGLWAGSQRVVSLVASFGSLPGGEQSVSALATRLRSH
jgi:hypothetical protein